jgi:hypothetical protein
MKEQWKSITETDGNYEVSNFGRVRRAKEGKGTCIGRIIKLYLCVRKSRGNATGYLSAALRDGRGRSKTYQVHVLVAKYFVGPRPVGKEVNHDDLDKTNNRWDNLEYMTPEENLEHARIHGAFCGPLHAASGEDAGQAKLDWRQVRRIRELYSAGEGHTIRSLAAHFGVGASTVRYVINGSAWREENRAVSS